MSTMTPCSKVPFATRLAAEFALMKIQGRTRNVTIKPTRIYRCSCGAWHLSSLKQQSKECCMTPPCPRKALVGA